MTITFFRGPSFAGKVRNTPSGDVTYVDVPGADICFKQYTADYGDVAAKKFLVTSTRRRYATLEAAAAAVVKLRTTGAQA